MTNDELYLYARNDGQIYRDRLLPLYERLAAQKSAGTYQRDDAVARFLPIAKDAAIKYRREFPDAIFSPAIQRATANELADYFETEWDLGNMPGTSSQPRPRSGRKSSAQLRKEIDQAIARPRKR